MERIRSTIDDSGFSPLRPSGPPPPVRAARWGRRRKTELGAQAGDVGFGGLGEEGVGQGVRIEQVVEFVVEALRLVFLGFGPDQPRDGGADPEYGIGAPEGATPSPDQADPPSLDAQLQTALAESAQNKDALLRALADAENIRRRSAAEVISAHKYAVEDFAGNLLAVNAQWRF